MSKNRIPLIYLSLALVTITAFWNVSRSDFINYDDPAYITENVHIQQGITLQSIRWAFTTGYHSNWHPLTWISHMLDFQLFGLNPVGAHMINLLLHIVNTLLLFFIFRRMTKAVWQSAFVAALFALHPLHVESVAWAAERKDVLSTFFWMLTIAAYCRYVERPGLKKYFPVLLFFILGLMAKPMLVSLPLVLLLLDYWPLQRFGLENTGENSQKKMFARLVLEKIPLFLLSALSSAITFMVQKKGGAIDTLTAIPLTERISNAFVTYFVYIGKMVWPDNLAIFYPYPKSIPQWEIAGAVLIFSAVTLAILWALRASRKLKYLAVGWFWYLITLVPVIGIVQVGLQARADRYTYIPLTGLFIMAAWGVPALLERWHIGRKTLFALAFLILSCFWATTWVQASYWRNSVTIFGQAVKVTDGNYIAYGNLGNAYEKMGNYRQALQFYDKAVETGPRFPFVYYNRGFTYARLGDYRQAIMDYEKTIEINPGFASAYYQCGNAYAIQRNYGRAAGYYQRAIKADPGYMKAYFNLGNVYAAIGNYRQASDSFSKTIELAPGFAFAYIQRAVAYGRLGDSQKAYADIKTAAALGDKTARYFLEKNGSRPPDELAAKGNKLK